MGKRVVFGFAVAVGAMAATMSLASVAEAATFAAFTTGGKARNVRWENKSGSSDGDFYSTDAAGNKSSVQVNFKFLAGGAPAGLAAAVQLVPADFNLDSFETGNPVNNTGGVLTQPGIQGHFSFTYVGIPDIVVGLTHYSTGANLLSGVFQLGEIQGRSGSSAGGFMGATASGSIISMTSDFMSFAGSLQRDFSISMTSISPVLDAAAGKALRSFRASAGGAFSTASAVPEPSTWAVMIVGAAMVGAASRRRRARIAA
jgi:hypothetical protein